MAGTLTIEDRISAIIRGIKRCEDCIKANLKSQEIYRTELTELLNKQGGK